MAKKGLPSFFKVLIDDFKTTLRIPRLLVKKFEDILPQDALLKTKSGESWFVKIERIDGDYCFTHGWPKFVKDHQLQMCDFLVFWPMLGRKTIVKVSIYGVSGCEKMLNLGRKGEGSTSFSILENGNPSNCAPRFVSVLAKYHRSRLRIPMQFAKESGMLLKKSVVLKNSKGQSWDVQLKLGQSRGLEMAMGWPKFLKENGFLLDGRSCVFEFSPGANSIQVHDLGVLEKER